MGLFSKRAPKPEEDPAQAALQKRQSLLVDDEIEESNRRLKSLSRGRLGYSSLLGGRGKQASKTAGRTSLVTRKGGQLIEGPRNISGPSR